MGDVVELQAKLTKRWKATGEVTFMQCGCGSDMGLLPVVLHDAGAPLIVTIVCPECENEVPVVNGRLQIEAETPA